MNPIKISNEDLAVFGGNCLFDEIRSTSNLVKPDEEAFFGYLKKSFAGGVLTDNGSVTEEFENRLATLHGAKYCIAFCSGLWALVLAMKCLKLEGRTEVIMPSLTYRRLADIAAWLGLIPHFCDVSMETKGVTAEAVSSCINENTALIMGVQPIVNLCDIEGLVELAKKRRLPLLFDSVEAAYASFNGKMIGSFGDAECFSMHASKFLNGFEAGYITTNNGDLARALRGMRNSENSDRGPGMNANLSELHSAMGLASLDDLTAQIQRNRLRYEAYVRGLSEVKGLSLWKYSYDDLRSFKNIVVSLNNEWPLDLEDTLMVLHQEKLLARPYYSPPLHLKPAHFAVKKGLLTNTEALTNRSMLLPCGEMVNEDDVAKICAFLSFLEKQNPASLKAKLEEIRKK